MKDEIEEIINNLQRIADRKCYPEDILDGSIAQEWVDNITNLKEENDYLKDIVSNTELSDEIKKADKWSKRELYKINYQRLQVNKRLREENERLKSKIDEFEEHGTYIELKCDYSVNHRDLEKLRNVFRSKV